MSSKKHNVSRNSFKMNTDRDTDYLYEYFVNEDKFNEQLRGYLFR